MNAPSERPPIDRLRDWFVAGVASDNPDLTARQMAVLLTVIRTPEQHTVRGLAARLNVSKPAIARALDRLEHEGLVQRKVTPNDRRSVDVVPTPAGSAHVRRLAKAWESV
jgi:DNA-binding MarR family transcriptional regulator